MPKSVKPLAPAAAPAGDAAAVATTASQDLTATPPEPGTKVKDTAKAKVKGKAKPTAKAKTAGKVAAVSTTPATGKAGTKPKAAAKPGAGAKAKAADSNKPKIRPAMPEDDAPKATPKAKLPRQASWPQGEAAAAKGKRAKAPQTRAADAVKLKLVRDSFTMPELEYAQLAALKRRALALAHHAKKSELLRAGVAALAALDDTALIAALQAVPPLKTGRPKGPPAPVSAAST